MRFTLSDEQRELAAIVRAFLADKSPESAVRQLMATPEGFDPEVWAQMSSQLGLTGLAVPEEYGGSGFGYVELGLVFEELGRSLLCAPFFSSIALGAEVLVRSRDEAIKKELLPGVASGAVRATLALLEKPSGWDEAAVTMPAQHTAVGWTLSGEKRFVLDGHTAELILVAARADEGVGVFAVDASAAGLTRAHVETLDQTRKQAQLSFAETPARLVVPPGEGWDVVSRALQTAAIMLAAEQVGGASRALDMSVEYAKIRHQFGRPIGSFQAIKHKCADMLTELESARSAAYYGMWALDSEDADVAVAASIAKAFCSEMFTQVAGDNIQVHGGIGFTWEHPAHLYFKRAKTDELLLGSPHHHRELLAAHVGL
jgi:alkylation response protein AidB-like acyl-CoA dehydrogenase